MKICYIEKRFSRASESLIQSANEIIEEYQEQGFTLTLRQLYYQFVARDLLENTVKNYGRLGRVISDARLAGRIDWSAIEDRTRSLESQPHWDSPIDILSAVANQFRIDKWARQPIRPEVWIEKEALAGVFQRICQELDVAFFCCRGYASQSSVWQAGQRHLSNARDCQQEPIILHFGDHDPSGLDMTRDNKDRLSLFMHGVVEVRRLALNMNQVREYSPPPNPAKVTDTRFSKYANQYGDESWELDALEPKVLADLVKQAVMEVRDEDLWNEAVDEENKHRLLLGKTADRWDEVVEFLK